MFFGGNRFTLYIHLGRTHVAYKSRDTFSGNDRKQMHDFIKRATQWVLRQCPVLTKTLQIMWSQDPDAFFLADVGGSTFTAQEERAMQGEIQRALEKSGEAFDPSKLDVVGCGSISRVYRYDGRIALKVKVPGIERAMFVNYCWFLPIVALIDTLMGYRYHLWKRLDTFMESIHTQYNFPNEILALQSFQSDLEKYGFSDHLRTPRVFQSMCGENVIAMEYVGGTILSEYRARHPGGLTAHQAMLLLRLSISNLMLFHTSHLDLHGGNMIVEHDGKMVVIDFGMSMTSKRTSPKDVVAITLLLEATFTEDMERFVQILACRTTFLDSKLTIPLASNADLLRDLRFHMIQTYHRAYDKPLFTDRLKCVYRGVDEWLSKTPHVYTNECVALYEICSCHAVTLISADPDGLNQNLDSFVEFLHGVCRQQGCAS